MSANTNMLPFSHQSDSADFQQQLELRLIEQQTLSALARSLSAVLDLDTLLAQVVDAAVYLSNAEEGLLLLPDEEEEALYIRAVTGIDSETTHNFRIRTQDSMAGQVYRTGQPILIGDQGWQKIKTKYLVKSLLYVPLSIKGQTIGVLGVNNKHVERTFTTHDFELLQNLAAHAAIAIENARLYEESILRTQELSTLAKAGEAANSTLKIEQVLSIIAGQLIDALDVSQCYIGEWHPEQQELDTLAICYRALWAEGAAPEFPIQNTPAIEQAHHHNQIVVTSPPQLADGHVPNVWLPHRTQAQQVAYLPLALPDHTYGLVTFYRMHAPYPEAFDHHAVYSQLQRLAQDCVVMLNLDNNRHRKIIFEMIQYMVELAEADWGEIAFWHPVQQQFNPVVSYGKVIWHGGATLDLDLTQFPQLDHLLNNQTAFTNWPNSNDAVHPLSAFGAGKRRLGLPLMIKGKTAGLVLLIDMFHDRSFSRREIQLAQALVHQAANALDNARLFRDLETSLEKLRLTQKKLIQTARLSAMGELAAAVAHQINNPLTTVLGDAELVLRDLADDDPNSESLEAILRAGRRAHEVVRRLLTMARQPLTADQLEPINVNETIRNTLALVKGHLRQKNMQLIIRLDDDIPLTSAVRGQLEDVWLNLLLNARDAVGQRSQPLIGIMTAYESQQGHITVTIWDNGIGIPADQQSQVFEPFFTTKPSGEGTGLGLSICQQIIEKCQGSIKFQSTYNEGTNFIIRLPVFII